MQRSRTQDRPRFGRGPNTDGSSSRVGPSESWTPACLGPPGKKPTGILCSPGWAPDLWKRCVWLTNKNRYSCGHTAPWGHFPHAARGEDYHTWVAAKYPEGLTRHWAREIAARADDTRPIVVINPEDTESRQRIHRHTPWGPDPGTAREIREAENEAGRAGLRNPHPCTQGGERAPLKHTMGRVATFLKKLREWRPTFQHVTECFGEQSTRAPPFRLRAPPRPGSFCHPPAGTPRGLAGEAPRVTMDCGFIQGTCGT